MFITFSCFNGSLAPVSLTFDHTKWTSLNDQPEINRPTLDYLNRVENNQNLHHYPFTVKLDKFNGMQYS